MNISQIKIPHFSISDIRPRHIRLSLVDLLMTLLLCMLVMSYILHPSAVADVEFYKIATIALVYVTGRIVISQSPKYIVWLLLLVVTGWCFYEAVLGLMQVFDYRHSNHFLYACTGTFPNPGPFGGFLAVCLSLLVASFTVTKSKIWHYVAGATIFVVVIILPSTMSRSGLLGLGCSMAVLALSIEKYRNFIKKYWYAVLLASMIAGAGAYMFKKNSADGRFFMNKISVQAMLDNGLTGAGLGSFTGAYGHQQHDYFAAQARFGNGDIDISNINEKERLICDSPELQFNEYLRIGVEDGPIAMLLFVTVIMLAIIRLLKQKSPFAYGLITFSVFAFFSYPLYIFDFQLILAVFLAFAAISEGKGNIVSTSICVVSFLLLSLLFATQNSANKSRCLAKAKWAKTEDWYKKGYFNYAVEDGDSLISNLQHDFIFLYEYGTSLNKEKNYSKSDSVLMLGSSICSNPIFWIEMGNNSLARGNYREAEERYRYAFLTVPNRLRPLCLLAKLYDNECDTMKFLNIAKQIDEFKPKIESETTKKLRNEINDIKNKYIHSNEF